MILKLEIDSEDAMHLLLIHDAFMNEAAKRMGNDILTYSESATAVNNFFKEVCKKIPTQEIERITNEDFGGNK